MNFYADFNKDKDQFAKIFRQNKVVHVKPTQSLTDNGTYYRQLAEQCGIPLIYEEDPITGEVNMNKWTEIKYDPLKSDDAYKHSNKSQPLHTDYGYFSFEMYAAFFYCETQADFGGATTFIDVEAIVSVLSALDKDLFTHLQQTKVHFGRKDNPLAHNVDYILSKDELGWRINWNYYRAQGDKTNKGLVDDFKNFLDSHIEKSGELKELKLVPSEGVFFHDRRVLHGRNSFVGNRQLNKGGIAETLPEAVLKIIELSHAG